MGLPPPPRLSAMLLPVLLGVLMAAAAAEQAAGSSGATAGANALPMDPRFFLKQIFEKYGDGGVMSYEGFEHLLESLGLGRLAFDKRHSVALHRAENGSFREVHDLLRLHAHHHADDVAEDVAEDLGEDLEEDLADDGQPDERVEAAAGARERRSLAPDGHSEEAEALASAADPAAPNRCLSPQDILKTFGLQPHHDVVISPRRFLRMCPVIVYELDQRSCFRAPAADAHPGHAHANGHGEGRGSGHGHGELGARTGPDAAAWWRATLSVTLVSAAGLVAAAAAGPLLAGNRLLPVLEFLAAAGAGTLVGDALMHLLPHAMLGGHGVDSEEQDHREPVLRAAAAVFTVIAFFALEQLLRRLNAQEVEPEKGEKEISVTGTGLVSYEDRDGRTTELHAMLDMGESGAGAGGSRHSPAHGHTHGQAGTGDSVGAVAWMVILGDGVHNLTDGLAIGAAFSNDPVAGFATALAVFCHELPHEFGDFAVLLKSGMSLRNALFYNLFSSILSFLGMAIGVWIGNYESAAQWIYSATAGSFLYIALADLIPEMSRNADSPHTTLNTCLHLVGLLTGGGIMLAIGLYEDNLRSMFD